MKMDKNKVLEPLPSNEPLEWSRETIRRSDIPELPIIYYPLAALEKNDYIDEIVLVIRAEDKVRFDMNDLVSLFPTKPIVVSIGGENRYDSVYNGLLHAKGEISLIHDGARPLLKQQYISDCIEAMGEYLGAIIGVKSVDRLCFVDEESGIVQKTDIKMAAYLAQTPQCFDKKTLISAHEKIANKSEVKDDSTLLELCGYDVKMLPGHKANIKITFPEDLILAEKYINEDRELSILRLELMSRSRSL